MVTAADGLEVLFASFLWAAFLLLNIDVSKSLVTDSVDAVVEVVVVVVVVATGVNTACKGLLENLSTKLWKSGFGLGEMTVSEGLEVLFASFFLWVVFSLLHIDVSKRLVSDRRVAG